MGCSWQRHLACVIITSLLLTCLLVFVIIYLLPHYQCIPAKNSTQACDSREDGCNTKPIVLTDVLVVKTMASNTNFSQAWSDAEQKARKPGHKYIEKQHAVAIYMYTKHLLKHSTNKSEISEYQASKNETIYMDSKLYSSLSEAIQILKHSQVTCLKAIYRTQRHSHVDISNKQVRFGSFTLASDKRSLKRSSTCFQINTCFGVDISHYSALKTNHQVLIPPYEVFKVSDVHPDITEDCNIAYKLESNLDCVYDTNTKMLHPISASPAKGLWCVVIVTFVITVCIAVAIIIVKTYRKKTHLHSRSYFQPVTYYHAAVVMKRPTFNLQ
ncbi:T-cell ecto-ADP-ribosyltransferase 2-like [Vanacampus margaritifer]